MGARSTAPPAHWPSTTCAGRTSSTPPSAVVICHGFPVARQGAAETSAGLPQLAERLAAEVGWRAMAGMPARRGWVGRGLLTGGMVGGPDVPDRSCRRHARVRWGTVVGRLRYERRARPVRRGRRRPVAGRGRHSAFRRRLRTGASDVAAMVRFARQCRGGAYARIPTRRESVGRRLCHHPPRRRDRCHCPATGAARPRRRRR